MNRKELNTLIREALQKEQWKQVGGSWRYSPSRLSQWKKRLAAEPFPDADGDGVDDRDETTDDEEEEKRRMAARDALKAKYCLLYTSPSPRDKRQSRMPSSA